MNHSNHRVMDKRGHNRPWRDTLALPVTPILTLPGWLVTNRVKPAGNELRVLNHKQIRSVIVNGSEPVIDDKRLKQIGYQLELKCRDVEF